MTSDVISLSQGPFKADFALRLVPSDFDPDIGMVALNIPNSQHKLNW